METRKVWGSWPTNVLDCPVWSDCFFCVFFSDKKGPLNLGKSDYFAFHPHLFRQVLATGLSAKLICRRICPCNNVLFTHCTSHGALPTLLLFFRRCQMRTKDAAECFRGRALTLHCSKTRKHSDPPRLDLLNHEKDWANRRGEVLQGKMQVWMESGIRGQFTEHTGSINRNSLSWSDTTMSNSSA